MGVLSHSLMVPVIAYAIGCFPTGYWVVRWKTGLDVRLLGSGSTGATNVGRILGKRGFVIIMLLDMLKGMAAMWLSVLMGAPSTLTSSVILAVVAGHIFPLQLGFRGGKGLSTGFGALLIFDYRLACGILAATFLVWLVVKKPILCLAAVLVAAPPAAVGMGHARNDAVGLTITFGLILLAHRTNILVAWNKCRTLPSDKEGTNGTR